MEGADEEEVRARALLGASSRWVRKGEILRRQATAALKSAESMWIQLMSLLEVDAPETVGGLKLVQACGEQQSGGQASNALRGTSHRPLRGWSQLLQVDEKRLKTVAELYNPRRFQEPALKAGLIPGEAFDLELGYDVLQPPVRDYILNYFKVVKPGMTIISAMVRSDQCRFGLVSALGGLHMKPTGWLTNSQEIRASLDRQCTQDHEHEHVLGCSVGGPRARRSQAYPPRLVQAILTGYRRQLQRADFPIHFFAVADVLRDLDNDLHYFHAALIEHEAATREHQAGHFSFVEAWETLHADEDDTDDGGMEQAPRKYLPRERPFSLPTLIKRAHEGLGHVGNDRLARILKNVNASPQAIQLAKDYHCPLCEQQKKVQPARAAAPPRELTTNSTVGVDSIYLPGWDGQQKLALNVVCWATRFQMIIPLQNHTPAEARRGYLQWCRFMGPPDRIYSDLGREFRGAFELGAELDSTYIEPGSLEMPTQRSITERAGKSFKEVFQRAMAQHTCQSRTEWLELVDITTMVCNRLLNKSGYSPLQRVLGYNPRIPGSLFQGGFNDLATSSRYQMGDLQVQRSCRMRLAASRAFHEADCDQALRNALHAGTRIPQEFEAGQTVYFWRKATDRPKKNHPKYWRGPAKVILVSMPNSVWVTFRGIVIKAAPDLTTACERGGADDPDGMDRRHRRDAEGAREEDHPRLHRPHQGGDPRRRGEPELRLCRRARV